MKRVRVAPGKFVTISAELSEKAARVFGGGLSRQTVQDSAVREPRSRTLMLGSPKPLALSNPRSRDKKPLKSG
jgi:hypothetical protein